MCPILREIECDEFVCNKFVLVFLHIDNTICTMQIVLFLICNKTNTNLLHTNLLHSILRKIGHVIHILVHQLKQPPKKTPEV
jgi:hypothetical protein